MFSTRSVRRNITAVMKRLSNPKSKACCGMLAIVARSEIIAPTPSGHIPMYVGEGRKRYDVPVEYLKFPKLRELLMQSQEDGFLDFKIDGPITLPCTTDTFDQFLNQAKTRSIKSEQWFSSSDICAEEGSKASLLSRRKLCNLSFVIFQKNSPGLKQRPAASTLLFLFNSFHVQAIKQQQQWIILKCSWLAKFSLPDWFLARLRINSFRRPLMGIAKPMSQKLSYCLMLIVILFDVSYSLSLTHSYRSG